MKIALRILPTESARDALARDGEIASVFDLDEPVLVLDSEAEAFDRILELTRQTGGSRFYATLSFNREELGEAGLFQPECRKRGPLTDRDFRLNLERLESSQPVAACDSCLTRLLDRVAMSKLNLKPNVIASVGDWATEFVASKHLTNLFRDAGLSGLAPVPVFNPRTGADYPEYVQLFSKSLMPPVLRDAMIRPQKDKSTGLVTFRQLGCLAYPEGSRDRCMDFNRTAEPFTGDCLPDWVVSARVKDCYEKNEMKGWQFLPVLEEGTALHRDFIAKWKRLHERVMQNPNNVL